MSNNSKKLFYVTAGLILLVIFAVILFLMGFKNNNKDFIIVSTTPNNMEQNIKPEEILITFTTDRPVASINDYTITVNPPVNSQLRALSTFPTTTVTTQALGGLQTNTTYTVTVTNTQNKKATTWSFTTSGEQPESSSGAFEEEQKALEVDYYPLLENMPFENERFYATYSDRLTLKVKIKKNEAEAIKQEVNDWISSKGVDPATHTINYENAF